MHASATILAAAIIFPISLVQVLAAEHTKDSLETVKKSVAKKSAIVLDVREKEEWDEGHLKDARFIPLSELKKGMETERLEKLLHPADKDKKAKETVIYVHCSAGGRSLSAAGILKKQGFDARPLKQGYEDLLKAGFPKAEPKEDKTKKSE